jgi:hypothetical protein
MDPEVATLCGQAGTPRKRPRKPDSHDKGWLRKYEGRNKCHLAAQNRCERLDNEIQGARRNSRTQPAEDEDRVGCGSGLKAGGCLGGSRTAIETASA